MEEMGINHRDQVEEEVHEEGEEEKKMKKDD